MACKTCGKKDHEDHEKRESKKEERNEHKKGSIKKSLEKFKK